MGVPSPCPSYEEDDPVVLDSDTPEPETLMFDKDDDEDEVDGPFNEYYNDVESDLGVGGDDPGNNDDDVDGHSNSKLPRPPFLNNANSWSSFADVTLVSAKDEYTHEYVYFKVNRAVLAASSGTLGSTLELLEVEGVEASLILTELPPWHLELFVQFIQTGRLDMIVLNDNVHDSFLNLGVDLDRLDLEKVPVNQAGPGSAIERVELRPLDIEATSMLRFWKVCQLVMGQSRIACEEDLLDKASRVVDAFDPQEFDLMEEDRPVDNQATKGLQITVDDFFPAKPALKKAELYRLQRKRENLERIQNIAIAKPTPRHVPKQFFKCEFCPYIDTFTVDFVLHVCKMHKNKNPKHQYFCIFCEEGFENEKELKQHEKIVHPTRKLACKYCGVEFALQNHGSYYRHVLLHCGKPNLHCIQCGQEFEKPIQYSKHRHRHGPFHCNECMQCPRGKFLFNSWDEHQQHVHDFHNGVFKVVCGTCGDVFQSKNDLRAHNTQKHRKEQPTSICDMCGAEVITALLGRHRYLKHNIGEGWKKVNGKIVPQNPEKKVLYETCRVCGQMVQKSWMGYHLYRVHKDEQFNPNTLNTMDMKEARLPSDYHTFPGYGPCVVCGKTQQSKQRYQLHFATMHLPDELKPYHCRICNKGFGKKRAWVDHEEFHKNKRPHKCRFSGCNAAFNATGNRNAHEKSVHGDFKRPKRERPAKKEPPLLVC